MANTVKKSNALAKQICSGNYRYLYGAKGEDYTKELVEKFAKAYPSVYTASLKAEALKDADKGYKAIDCSGFVCKVLGISTQGSAALKNSAVKTFDVKKANAKPGMALWKEGHIAYVGEGLKIYEAASTKSDMQVSDFDKRASAFSKLIIVKGSALANEKTEEPATTTAAKVYPKYTGTSDSIVDALKAVGETDTSLEHRKKIAAKNGVNTANTSVMNTKLLGLLKAGSLIKA